MSPSEPCVAQMVMSSAYNAFFILGYQSAEPAGASWPDWIIEAARTTMKAEVTDCIPHVNLHCVVHTQ